MPQIPKKKKTLATTTQKPIKKTTTKKTTTVKKRATTQTTTTKTAGRKKAVKKSPPPEDPTPWLSDTPEGRLCRGADKKGISIDAYAALYKPKGPGQYTPVVIARAKALDRMWDAHAKQRVYQLGGSYNGRKEGD